MIDKKYVTIKSETRLYDIINQPVLYLIYYYL